MEYYDLPRNKAFLISAKGLIFNEQGQLLLVRKSCSDLNRGVHAKWEVPGGLIEIGEKTNDSLVREIREECGIRVVVGRLLATNDDLMKGFIFKNGEIKDVRIFVLGFYCRYRGGDIALSEEHGEYRWIKPEEIDQLDVVPNIKGLIKNISLK